jgi:hypothetical protein
VLVFIDDDRLDVGGSDVDAQEKHMPLTSIRIPGTAAPAA